MGQQMVLKLNDLTSIKNVSFFEKIEIANRKSVFDVQKKHQLVKWQSPTIPA
jgi:hypothetical protein